MKYISSAILLISLAAISKGDIYDGCSLGINCIAVPRSDVPGSDSDEKCVANKVRNITYISKRKTGVFF